MDRQLSGPWRDDDVTTMFLLASGANSGALTDQPQESRVRGSGEDIVIPVTHSVREASNVIFDRGLPLPSRCNWWPRWWLLLAC